jgi:hypothetical protein
MTPGPADPSVQRSRRHLRPSPCPCSNGSRRWPGRARLELCRSAVRLDATALTRHGSGGSPRSSREARSLTSPNEDGTITQLRGDLPARSTSMSAATTWALCAANRRDSASPCPADAPVINAVFASKRGTDPPTPKPILARETRRTGSMHVPHPRCVVSAGAGRAV